MINYIKVAAIWVADIINLCYNPFQKAVYAPPVDMIALESAIYENLRTYFVDSGRFKYQLPVPSDEGDSALFQGLYTAMMNFKYPDATPDLRAANAALGGFFIDGILIRGIRSDGTINDTTSNDAATGALFGLYSIWCKGTWEADATIQRWARSIVDSGYALTNLKGVPTQYGQLEQGWKTDPLRITLLLAIVSLAAHTEAAPPSFSDHYKKLYNAYLPILKYPKVRLLWWDTDYDTHRAAIHLHVLYNLTGDKVYADGLGRIARITERENNAWVQTLCWPFNGLEPEMGILGTFDPLTFSHGNIEARNDVPSVKWGDKVYAKSALPAYKRGSQDFLWQRNMFSKDEWVGNATPDTHYSGLDFLICYWLAVRLKLLEGTH